MIRDDEGAAMLSRTPPVVYSNSPLATCVSLLVSVIVTVSTVLLFNSGAETSVTLCSITPASKVLYNSNTTSVLSVNLKVGKLIS